MAIDKEFPEFDNIKLFNDLLAKLAPHGFEDTSWHNDELPSISIIHDDNDRAIILWVNFLNDPLADSLGVFNTLEMHTIDGFKGYDESEISSLLSDCVRESEALSAARAISA